MDFSRNKKEHQKKEEFLCLEKIKRKTQTDRKQGILLGITLTVFSTIYIIGTLLVNVAEKAVVV